MAFVTQVADDIGQPVITTLVNELQWEAIEKLAAPDTVVIEFSSRDRLGLTEASLATGDSGEDRAVLGSVHHVHNSSVWPEGHRLDGPRDIVVDEHPWGLVTRCD